MPQHDLLEDLPAIDRPVSALMCCGCNRLMTPDGKPLTQMRFVTGKQAPEPVIPMVRDSDIAWFSSKEQADEAARKFGWRAENGNHRCPECVAEESKPAEPERYGAYLTREDLGL